MVDSGALAAAEELIAAQTARATSVLDAADGIDEDARAVLAGSSSPPRSRTSGA